MMRRLTALFFFAGASVLPAQETPDTPPTDSMSLAALVRDARASLGAGSGTSFGARIWSSDGRVLVSRASVAWLADSASVNPDSAIFRVTLIPGRSLIAIAGRSGGCLATTAADPRTPLTFGPCERALLFVYPAPGVNVLSGEQGFWLVSELGRVGPTRGSTLLIPRSDLGIWFRLVPTK